MEEIKKEETKETNLLAILSYISILCLIPLLMKEKDEFVKFHAKQGLVLFIAEVVTMMVGWVPFLGWLIGMVCGILWLVLSIMGIINVLNGKRELLPLIGKFAEKFKI